MSALETKGRSELDQFISARTNFADFLDAALENACSTFGVEVSRLLVSKTYMYPPADCGTAWKTKGDNRQLQYDAIAVLNGDIREDVFIDGDAIMAKRNSGIAEITRLGSGFGSADKGAIGLAARVCHPHQALSGPVRRAIDGAKRHLSKTCSRICGSRSPEDRDDMKPRRQLWRDDDRDLPAWWTAVVQMGGGVKMAFSKFHSDHSGDCIDYSRHFSPALAVENVQPSTRAKFEDMPCARPSIAQVAAHSAVSWPWRRCAPGNIFAGAKPCHLSGISDPLFQRAVAGLGRAHATSSFRANQGPVDRGYRLPHVSARAPVAEW